jgi:hypothetical protein
MLPRGGANDAELRGSGLGGAGVGVDWEKWRGGGPRGLRAGRATRGNRRGSGPVRVGAVGPRCNFDTMKGFFTKMPSGARKRAKAAERALRDTRPVKRGEEGNREELLRTLMT